MSLNLNPGTLSTVPFPLGAYERGRNAMVELRKELHEKFKVPEDEVFCPAGGTSTVMNMIGTALYPALSHKTGDKKIKILTSSHEHYGGVGGLKSHSGYDVIAVSDEDIITKFRQVVEQHRPHLIFLSSVTYDIGLEYPIQGIANILKSTSIDPIFIVDIAQSLGLVPLNLTPGMGIDLIIGSTHKWLRGPPGTSIGFMSKRLAEVIRPFIAASNPLDPTAFLGFLEESGGQDFSKIERLHSSVKRYFSDGPFEILQESQKLTYYFFERVVDLFNCTNICIKYFGRRGEINVSTAKPNDFLGTLVIAFEKWDAYPLYNFLNRIGIHTKLIKLDNVSYLRLGFLYTLSIEDLDLLLNGIKTFFEIQ